jgi:hypothetical protein
VRIARIGDLLRFLRFTLLFALAFAAQKLCCGVTLWVASDIGHAVNKPGKESDAQDECSSDGA